MGDMIGRASVFLLLFTLCGCECGRQPSPGEPAAGALQVDPGEPDPEQPDPLEALDEAPILSSDWVRDSAPDHLLPPTLADYQVVTQDGVCTLEREGEVVWGPEAGTLACSAGPMWLACVHSSPVDEPRHYQSGFLFGALSAEAIEFRITQDFFDERRVTGPPRFTQEGALWISLADHWERREVGWPRPAPISSVAREEGQSRIRTALPSGLDAEFRELALSHRAALMSEPVDAERAHAIWQGVHAPLSAVVVTTDALAPDTLAERASAERVAAGLARARELPADALWARLEATRLAWHEDIRTTAPEFAGYSLESQVVLRARGGDVPALPPMVSAQGAPAFVRAAQVDQALRQMLGDQRLSDQALGDRGEPSRYVVVVVEGDTINLPIELGFGGFNHCPPPYQHSVALRYWQERFGARLLAMTRDTLEVVVSQTPETLPESYELAWRHLLYNGDMELRNHVAQLQFPRWSFWWD